MKPILWSLLLGALSAPLLAGTWSGDLVDSGCFRNEETNVSPDYLNDPGARDFAFELRACLPRAGKTKKFDLILADGESLKLDAAGNAKAAALVRATPKPKRYFVVRIAGEVRKDTIQVVSIAAAK